ncbi:MAG: toll/interleukin-1 receptor domain-containing protein [Solirubrobacterales bacterium]
MYRLVLISDDDEWAKEVGSAVREVVHRILQRDDLLHVSTLEEALADSSNPATVAVLASAGIAGDKATDLKIEQARASSFAVVPLIRPEDDAYSVIPESIKRLNAIPWTGSSDDALAIVRILGIAEEERRLFLSYRRTDSEQLALQIRRSLTERGYDVFLDRFSVPPGDDFQERLNTELADKAFVLLLESMTAVGSEWVQHEVSYALAHGIAVLALSLPDANPDGKFAVVDDAFRLQVNASDLTGDIDSADRRLTEDALIQVLDEVELQAARQLRRRREQLLGGLSDFLFQAGARRMPVDPWAILGDLAGRDPELFLVTPRAPTPYDVQLVDNLRADSGLSQCQGRVVHDVADRDIRLQGLLDWMIEDRPLQVSSLPELADEFGL